MQRTFFLRDMRAQRRVGGTMKRLLPATLLVLAFASCHGTKDFTIHTEPEGAEITINGKPCTGLRTPMTVTISQEKNLGITATKPGYEVAGRTVETKTGFWTALLWNKHDPRAQYIEEDEVTIPLRKIPTAASFVPTSLPGYQPPAPRCGIEDSPIPALREMPEF